MGGLTFCLVPIAWKAIAIIITNPPINVYNPGTSFTPNNGIQHHITPPITSVKDRSINSAAGRYLAPILNKIKPFKKNLLDAMT